MPNPTNYITPQKAFELDKESNPAAHHTLEWWISQAKTGRKCSVCDDAVWRFGECGMCFTCTTGEADPSDDYEVIAAHEVKKESV